MILDSRHDSWPPRGGQLVNVSRLGGRRYQPSHQLIKRLQTFIDVVADSAAVYNGDLFYRIIQYIVVQIKIVRYFC